MRLYVQGNFQNKVLSLINLIHMSNVSEGSKGCILNNLSEEDVEILKALENLGIVTIVDTLEDGEEYTF